MNVRLMSGKKNDSTEKKFRDCITSLLDGLITIAPVAETVKLRMPANASRI